MGGLAGAAGGGRLSAPIWLQGPGATLPVAPDRPVLWLVDLDDAATRALAEGVAAASGETAAFARHRDAGDRLLRRRLARRLLATAAEVPADTVAIEANALGAPAVANLRGWYLSVAARWPACLVAIAREPIGVDLEVATTPLPDDLLTAGERAAIAALPAAERAVAGAAAWAAKEAHAKWTGRPRTLDPCAVETGEEGFVTSPLGRTRCWRHRLATTAVALCRTAAA